MDVKKAIFVWGILDLAAFSSYVAWQIFQGRVPFYDDVLNSIQTLQLFDLLSLNIFPILFIILYVSLVFSGIYLLKYHRFGLILGFIQVPFRMLFLIPPSIFFIIWPLKYLLDDPRALLAIIMAIILVFLSEALKLYSLFQWRNILKVTS